jgi:hypothetical protein
MHGKGLRPPLPLQTALSLPEDRLQFLCSGHCLSLFCDFRSASLPVDVCLSVMELRTFEHYQGIGTVRSSWKGI